MNAAVIGIGNMGRHHARVYSELDNINLVAVADLNETQGKELSEKFKCKYYSDYKEMIKNESLDIISIGVPNTLHKEVALDCINKDINVLIEKPIADTLENAKIIMDNAKGVVTVGHIERFNPVIQKLKELLKNNEIGDITSIVAKRVGLFPPQIKDANVIVDLGVHDIDICSYLLNKQPDKVHSLHGHAFTDREDYAEIMLKYGKINAIIQTNWITPIKIRNIAITGTKGYLEANYLNQTITIYKRNVNKDFNDFGDFMLKFGEPEKVLIEVAKKEPLKEEIIAFINSVKTNTAPLVSLQDAYDALRIALDASK